MGVPLYGQSFTLSDAQNNGLNAKAPGPGQAGEHTKAAGFLAYYEVSLKQAHYFLDNHSFTTHINYFK